MSEAKNTALGGSAGFGYSRVSPAKYHPPLSILTTMITATLILAALTLLTAADESCNQDPSR